MKLSNCKLKKRAQLKLLEYFVLKVTARSMADLLETHPNSATFFHKKIRLLVSYYLEQKELEVFDGEVELDESYFGGIRKGKRGRVFAGKAAVFGLWDYCEFR